MASQKTYRPYSEKLRDSRWQKKRLELLEKAAWRCQEDCCQNEDPNPTLNVHHKLYLRGVEPWGYEDWAYQVLCEECHKCAQNNMEGSYKALARLNLSQHIARLESMSDVDLENFKQLMGFLLLKPDLRSIMLTAAEQSSRQCFEAWKIGRLI